MVLSVVTMFVGLFVIVILAQKGVKAAVIIGMLAGEKDLSFYLPWLGLGLADPIHTTNSYFLYG